MVATRSDISQAVHSHRKWPGIEEEEGLYYLCSENEGVDNCGITVKLICAFVSSPEPKAHKVSL